MSERQLIWFIRIAWFCKVAAPFALVGLGFLIYWLFQHLKIGWH
jgi:hypothetical protein